MKTPTHAIELHDYSPALKGAVSWMGDRYLLAEPVPRRSGRPPPRWQPAHAEPKLNRFASRHSS
jgi:hypothetical protein